MNQSFIEIWLNHVLALIAKQKAWILREFEANRRVARDILPTLASRVFVILGGLISSILTAKALGPAGRGEYFFIVTLAQFAVQFGNLGFGSTNTYAIVRDPDSFPRLAANSFWISLGAGIIAALSMMLGCRFGEPKHFAETFVLLVMVPNLIYSQLAPNILIGMGLTKRYNEFMALNAALQLAAICLVVYFGGGVTHMLWISAGATSTSAFGLWLLLRNLGSNSCTFHWATFRKHLWFAARVYIATLLPYAVSRLNVFMVEGWSNLSELGYYSIAMQIFDTLLVLPGSTAMLLFPDLIRADTASRLDRTLRLTLGITLIMTLGCAALAVISIWLIPLMFGQLFAPAVGVLWCILPGVVAASVVNIVSQYLAAEGFPASNLVAWAIGIPVLAIAGYALIPTYGAKGASLSFTLAYTFLALTFIIISVRHRQNSK